MSRVYNFSAGPAVLPDPVLEQAKEEILDWHGTGMSIMEMSHRGEDFTSVAKKAEIELRELMAIPDNYKVLFLQGGASSQFAMIPMNLLRGKTTADYINTGDWSVKAIAEAKKYCQVNIAATTESSNFTTVPSQTELKLDPNAAYVHYTPNETIRGVEFDYIPDTGNVPLIADMSSSILSRVIDISRFAMIYAGAQKNIGPAGLTLVIIRDDLLGDVLDGTPTMYNYQVMADYDSMYNTPPTYGFYLAGLVFSWLKELGGVRAIADANKYKAAKLYAAIDSNPFYSNPVDLKYRSRMNVPFTLVDAKLDSLFLSEAEARGLLNLKGHRAVGGMRASIYNAMSGAGVSALIDFMAEFSMRHDD